MGALTEKQLIVADAKKVLETKFKKHVYKKGYWCLRFHHRIGYFEYWPTTGKIIYARGERRLSRGSETRWRESSHVEHAMDTINIFCDWVELHRNKEQG